MSLKINSLQFENVKRIKAVQLKPSENGLTIIGGDNEHAATVYQENWNSVGKHVAAPEWFKDAKFGIYFHWGAEVVAENIVWRP